MTRIWRNWRCEVAASAWGAAIGLAILLVFDSLA